MVLSLTDSLMNRWASKHITLLSRNKFSSFSFFFTEQVIVVVKEKPNTNVKADNASSLTHNGKFKDFNVAVKSIKDTKVRQQQEVY